MFTLLSFIKLYAIYICVCYISQFFCISYLKKKEIGKGIHSASMGQSKDTGH